MASTDSGPLVLLDTPADGVFRLTLNRPDKRNALSHRLRSELFDALREGNLDPEVRVVVIRAAGPDFCAGYDLRQAPAERSPWPIPSGPAGWARHVAQGWFEMWDLDIAVIAQVQGRCLAGGTELVAACDLVVVAEDAELGYPVVRSMAPPDFAWQPAMLGFRRSMEALLTGDSIRGTDAVAAGLANRAVPAADLDEVTLELASRVALVPKELTAINKRVVHRAMEAFGVREAIRTGIDLHAQARQTDSSRETFAALAKGSLTERLEEREAPFR